MPIRVHLIKSVPLWSNFSIINRPFVYKIFFKVLKHLKLDNFELSILLTNNDLMQKLNNQFLEINKPTNVLSFPMIEKKDIYMKSKKIRYLGDIALGYEKILEESEKNDVNFKNHVAHLIIHGILHLLGFDHKNESEAILMENLEIKILKMFNIDSPY